jgi:hypothetical protein
MTTKRMNRKYVWAYFDGKPMVEVIQAALDNKKTVSEMKAFLIRENPGYTVTFVVTEGGRLPV